MRRVAVAVIIGGYAFWGIGSGLGHQPAIVGASLTADVKPVKTANPGRQIVKFGGYTVSVPASWPVYNLNKDPRRCVRYDVHAVYLGTPGSDQNCPPRLVGRVDTVSIEGPAVQARKKIAGDRKAPAQTGQRALAPGTIVQDPDLHELALAMPDTAPRIDATYGTDPGTAEQMLATVQQSANQQGANQQGANQQGANQQGANQQGATQRAGDSIRVTRHPVVVEAANLAHATNPAWPKVTATPSGLPPGWTPWSSLSPTPTPPPTPTPTPTPTGPGAAMAGFDTCAAPSLPTMKAWRARYAAVGIYIGGQMMACRQSNLSASWVQQAEAMGWSLMPTFVGLQAPCDSFSGKIDPKQAAAQGSAAANQAIADANSYGLGAGSPVYYDMEAYDHTNAGCRTAVLTFLDAWTRQLTAGGYVSGVYSSAGAAIIDLQSTTTIAGHPLAEPPAIWFALWDNANNLTGAPYMTCAVWPMTIRSKQYAGNRVVKVGGISLDIDADWVASAVARG